MNSVYNGLVFHSCPVSVHVANILYGTSPPLANIHRSTSRNDWFGKSALSQQAVSPPSTTNSVAVMYEASSESRKRIAFATSQGVPARCSGTRLMTSISAWRGSEAASVPTSRRSIEESTSPGKITFTRILWRAKSSAADRVSPSKAALVLS